MMKCRVNDVPFYWILIFTVLAFGTPSVTDNLSGRYHTISGYDILITEDDGQTIKNLLWNQHINPPYIT